MLLHPRPDNHLHVCYMVSQIRKFKPKMVALKDASKLAAVSDAGCGYRAQKTLLCAIVQGGSRFDCQAD